MSFYLTLPSNSSTDTFSMNTQSNYTTLLHKAINLNDKYQVGLAEISYPISYLVNVGSITIIQNFLYEDVFKDKFGEKKIDLIFDDYFFQVFL